MMNMINDTQHRDTFSPLFMSTNSATSASVAQKRHHFDMKKQEAYVSLLTCLQTKQSATLITLVESKTLMEQNGVHVADGDLLRKFQGGFLPLHRDAGNGGYSQHPFKIGKGDVVEPFRDQPCNPPAAPGWASITVRLGTRKPCPVNTNRSPDLRTRNVTS